MKIMKARNRQLKQPIYDKSLYSEACTKPTHPKLKIPKSGVMSAAFSAHREPASSQTGLHVDDGNSDRSLCLCFLFALCSDACNILQFSYFLKQPKAQYVGSELHSDNVYGYVPVLSKYIPQKFINPC